MRMAVRPCQWCSHTPFELGACVLNRLPLLCGSTDAILDLSTTWHMMIIICESSNRPRAVHPAQKLHDEWSTLSKLHKMHAMMSFPHTASWRSRPLTLFLGFPSIFFFPEKVHYRHSRQDLLFIIIPWYSLLGKEGAFPHTILRIFASSLRLYHSMYQVVLRL